MRSMPTPLPLCRRTPEVTAAAAAPPTLLAWANEAPQEPPEVITRTDSVSIAAGATPVMATSEAPSTPPAPAAEPQGKGTEGVDVAEALVVDAPPQAAPRSPRLTPAGAPSLTEMEHVLNPHSVSEGTGLWAGLIAGAQGRREWDSIVGGRGTTTSTTPNTPATGRR